VKHLCLALAVVIFGAQASFATPIVLTSGTSGSTVFGQSYNETRGVDLTVLTSGNLGVTSMQLDGLSIGAASSALVGARIYDSGTTLLLASANTTIVSSGVVSLPIFANLSSGGTYRLAFYVETDPSQLGSGTFFDPNPPGSGGSFPYTESLGLLRINNAYSIVSDSFPSTQNFFVPQITVQATAVPEPSTVTLLGLGIVALCGWRRRKCLEEKNRVRGRVVLS
jgi:hypothetical protein